MNRQQAWARPGAPLYAAALASLGFFLSGCASTQHVEPLPPKAVSLVQAAAETINAGEFEKSEGLLNSLKALPSTKSLDMAIAVLEERLGGKSWTAKLQKNATLKLDAETLPFGKSVTARLELKNPDLHSALTIPGKKQGKPGLLGRLSLTSWAYDAYGSQIRDLTMRSFSTDEGIEIAANSSWSQESTVVLNGGEGVAAKDYWIQCDLRLGQVMVDGKTYNLDTIILGPVKVRALLPGYEKVAANPLSRIEDNIGKEGDSADLQIFIASLLIPENQKKAAVRACAKELSSTSNARQRVAINALRWLTGEKIPMDVEPWKLWWSKRQRDYEEAGKSAN